MYSITRIHDSLTSLAFQALTFPRYRVRLQLLKPSGSIVAIAATFQDHPVGLALAEILPDGITAEILSIFVVLQHRQRGIGTSLLSHLQTELVLQGCTNAQLVYTTSQPTAPMLERLLQQNHWTSPQPRMILCNTTIDKIAQAPWMQKSKLPSSYEIVPWMDITAAERADIAQRQALKPWVPPALMPFQNEVNLEPLNSLGLRYQEQVVGWLLTHRLAADTIRYTCSFVRQDLQKLGRIIPLYVNAIQRQIDAEIPKGIWTVPFGYPAMVSFVRQRMAPYMIAIAESRISAKNLIQHPVKVPTAQI